MLGSYDLREAWTAGATNWLSAAKAMAELPLNRAVTQGYAHPISASAQVVLSLVQHRPKPNWGIDAVEIDGQSVGIGQQIISDLPFCQLIRFVPVGRDVPKRKLLLVAPMSGHHATLLRKTVIRLLPNHDVYVTDWADAKMVLSEHGQFGVDDYIDYVMSFLRSFDEPIHVMAVCQPAPLVLAAVALLSACDDPRVPKSMTLMGGPVDPAAAPTAVTKFAEATSLATIEQMFITEVPAIYPGANRLVYPGHVQLGAFMSMNPERHGQSFYRYYQNILSGDAAAIEKHRSFYDEYLTVMDTSADFYLETVDRIFQRRLLATGGLRWRGHSVEPQAITKTALLTVEGERDDISAPGQTLAAQALCANIAEDRRQHHVEPEAGHYGIFSGRRWRQGVSMEVENFIAKFD